MTKLGASNKRAIIMPSAVACARLRWARATRERDVTSSGGLALFYFTLSTVHQDQIYAVVGFPNSVSITLESNYRVR